MVKGKFKYYLLFAILVCFFTPIIWFVATGVSSEDFSDLRDGDLVFQTIKSAQTAAIAFATASPYTHVGIVKIDKNKKVKVIEAVGPVREISLDKWLEQGVGGRIAVKRFEGLSQVEVDKIISATKKYFGKPYDFLFTFDKETIYCSELIYYAFDEAINIKLGKIEKIAELYVDNEAVQKIIEQRWESHPNCQQGEAVNFEACYEVIMQQELISPESMANDPRLKTIFTNYGFLD